MACNWAVWVFVVALATSACVAQDNAVRPEDKWPAVDRYVSPDGKPDATGERNDPWDLASALSGERPTGPGFTIWLRGGVYRDPNRHPSSEGFRVNLVGAPERPIVIRACKGERATIDGGLLVKTPTADVWFQDIEMIVSEVLASERVFKMGANGQPEGAAWPPGGVYCLSGERCKFISMVVHHSTSRGIVFWESSRDMEAHACIVYETGYRTPEGRAVGGSLTLRNIEGEKWLTDNVVFDAWGGTISSYGTQQAHGNNLRVIGNTVIVTRPYRDAPIAFNVGTPMMDLRLEDNVFWNTTCYVSLRQGSEKHVAERNTVIDGRFWIGRAPEQSVRDNRLVPPDVRPEKPEAILRPNRYDKGRAVVTVINWTHAESVPLDPGNFLKDGDAFDIRDVRDVYGAPVVKGTYAGKPIPLPMQKHPKALADFHDVGAFVLVKDPPGR